MRFERIAESRRLCPHRRYVHTVQRGDIANAIFIINFLKQIFSFLLIFSERAYYILCVRMFFTPRRPRDVHANITVTGEPETPENLSRNPDPEENFRTGTFIETQSHFEIAEPESFD